ncbi:ATP-binding protein [Roseateles toxinivorans]|uniref:histidine kinase n=1 Tax=Roseateles toxinivorans TaxID=270368 RepID=A0A4R6QJQ3_9BURK|nr:ATP-binding protein [Roseateles toxinivorans]TDP62518.1 PAS/PAC sensor signal transduction histidine kinase [Roseateles toxinivorans]
MNRRDTGAFGWYSMLTLVAALALACAVLAAVVTFVWLERREALESARERSELLARVLEDHVTRTVDAAGTAMGTLAEAVALQPELNAARLQPQLAHALVGMPFLRGVALLNLRGEVLASSAPSEVGLVVDMGGLGPIPAAGTERLQALLPGRGLRDLSRPRPAAMARNVHVLPLLRHLSMPDGRPLLLLGLINPDALANYQQTVLSGLEGAALLTGYDAQLLTATEALNLPAGDRLREHPVFLDWLPDREHGVYEGRGAMPGAQVVAFRVSRTRPLVVIVEQDRAVVLARLNGVLGGVVIAGVAALLVIAAATAVIRRSLRARERSSAQLDAAHEQVALRERELSVLMKSVQELIFRADTAGAISFVNARWSAISADGADHALGRKLQDLVDPADRAAVAGLFNIGDGRGVRQAEASVPGRDGEPRRFDFAVVPLRSQGQIVGFAGSAVDVTERFVARQRLQHQLAFTGLLLEMSPLPVSMFDAQLKYVTVNQAWEEFTGRDRAEVIGRQVGYFTPRDEAAQHEPQDARLLRDGGRVRYETQVRHRDGSRRDMLITKVAVPDEQGGIAGILCTLMDVSEFRDAERATREARDVAEEASRAKSEFIANISHELRTPLQTILGFSELGLVRGRDQPKLAGMFGDIHASGQRMLALVNDLLDVAKIESPVGTFDLERCDLRGLLQETLRELDPLLARKRLRPRLTLPGWPLSARVDPLRFQQVLRNVLANAIKFSPEDGPLELTGELTADGEIHLSIADRGPGIPEAEVGKIFEAFVQSSQTKDGSGGTGLGLAICRKIVEIHGGRIHAENRPGGGAVFHVFVPAKVSGDTQIDESM